MVEEHAQDLVPFLKGRLAELVRCVGGLVRVGPLVYHYAKLHALTSLHRCQKRIYVEALRLLRDPRQLSTWNFVNGKFVSLKNRGQPI